MIMTAEELISEKCHNLESKLLQGHLVVIDKVAFEAVELARTEERENAVKQLQIVLTAIVARNDSKINFGDIIDQFTELINQ